ncbi:hypothetical protein AXG53_09435 [Stenotrophomonas sp. KCTC 12332]|nr:hypothetical protein AXG53_09435 [Stenotrophomonas sp. KCTC 12332]
MVHVQQFAGMQNGKAMRISAVKGARYVLAEMHGGVAAGDISVKRVGKNLVIEQQKAGVEPASVVIEEFYGSEGQLVGLGADGEYLEYLAASEGGATEASAMTDGATAQLILAAGQPVVLPSSFALAEGGSSVFSGALAGVAALAAGAALSNNKSGGSKTQPAPAASAFVLEDQPADADADEPAPAAVEPGVSAVVQDAGDTAGPVAEVHSEAGDVSADNAAINDNASNANTNEDAAPVESSTAPEAEAITSPDSASNANTNENAAPAESTTAPEAEAITSPGLVDAPAAVVPFAVDDVPVIEKVMDDHGVIQGVIENGGYTDDVYPTLMGHADPGVKVHVYRGKYLQGYTVADENGVWSYTPSSAYASGTHSMTVKYEYPNKDTSGYSEPYIITIDKIAPGIPKITGILDDEGRITGAITDQTITDDNRPTITGTAEANAKLIVYDKGKQIGSTTVGADGTWSFTPDTPLADGLHMLSYSAVDRAGNSGEQTDVTEFTVDTRPEKINIYYAEDDVGSVTDEVFSGGVTDDSTPTLFGTATAGGIVKIYEGSVLLGQVVADVDGTWQFTPPTELSEGAHTFHATVTLVAKGESGPSRPFKLEVDLTPPSIPTIEQVLDDVGAVQGVIENGQHTDDATPTLSGKAEAGSTVRIYDNGSLLGTAVTDAKGVWTFTPPVGLDEGEHMFTISAADAAGNVTASPAQYEITIDSTRPDAPKIVSVLDDVGDVQGPLQNGDRTDDTQPTFVGTAEANSTVIIRDHGVEIGRVQADGNGQWQYTPASELATGPHGISVISVDVAGNASQPTESFDFTISLLPPSGPSITSIYDDVGSKTGELRSGAITDDDMPRVNGRGDPYTTIVLTDNGQEIGRTQVDAAGYWNFLPTFPLSQGVHNLVATEINAQGETTGTSGTFGFRIAVPGQFGGFENFNEIRHSSVAIHREDLELSSGLILTGTFRAQPTEAKEGYYKYRPEDAFGVLETHLSGSVRMELPTESSTLSFHHLTSGSGGVATYFDANGEVIGQSELSVNNGSGYQRIYFQAPEGKYVASIAIVGGSYSTMLDALQWGERYPSNITISKAETSAFGDRIIYGSVDDMPYLLPNMVIQVSTDGGKTWTDAAFSEGSWAVIQHKMPPGDWTAEVRIAERSSGLSLGLSHSKYVQAQSVGAPVIERIPDAEGVYTVAKASDGALIEVSLTATDAKQGDRIHVRWGTISHDQVLYKADIDAGHVTVRMPADQLLEHGASKDFSVIAKIIGKNGHIGAASAPYEVVINHLVDTRDPNVITSAKESFFGSDANDVVTLQMYAWEYVYRAESGIYGGGGIDTLKLIPLQNSIVPAGLQFNSMEIIDLGLAGAHVQLSLSDVLRNSGTDIFYKGNESRLQMMVKGGAGGSGVLELKDVLPGGFELLQHSYVPGGDLGTWEYGSQVVIDGLTYTSYRHSALNVEVLTYAVKVILTNRAEFVDPTPRERAIEYWQDADIGEAGSIDALAQSPAGLDAAARGGISSLLQPVEPELFAAGGSLLNAAGAGDRGTGGITYPAHGFSTDLFDHNQVSYLAY